MMNPMVKSKPIPARTKRLLRRESGYGCNKCGNPIYQYHHIVPQSNDIKDLMLLCPNCHTEATLGAMTVEEQRRFKSNPYNVEKGYSNGFLKINQSVPAINIGNIQFINQGEIFYVRFQWQDTTC